MPHRCGLPHGVGGGRRDHGAADITDDAGDGARAGELASALEEAAAAGPSASLVLRGRARLAAQAGDLGTARDLARAAADAAGATMFERAVSLAELAEFSGPEAVLLRAEADTILGELGVVDVPRLTSPRDPSAARPLPEAEPS